MSNERIVCAACGSNNFATQAACWKCGRALATAAATPVASPTAASLPITPTAAPAESPAALWSSVALGVLFPAISIPVGLVFLMLDDKRKAQIGWWNILFGLVGTVLNGLLVAATLMPMLMNLSKLVPGLGSRNPGQSQDMNSEAAPLDLPGQRPFGSPPR